MYGIFSMSLGGVQALLNVAVQARSAIGSLSTTLEQLQIARWLVGELAALLNDNQELLILRAENSRQKLVALGRRIDTKALDVSILFHQVRHVAAMLHDVNGNNLQVALEGQLLTGVLTGLTSPQSKTKLDQYAVAGYRARSDEVRWPFELESIAHLRFDRFTLCNCRPDDHRSAWWRRDTPRGCRRDCTTPDCQRRAKRATLHLKRHAPREPSLRLHGPVSGF
jgi:hypothetical protein